MLAQRNSLAVQSRDRYRWNGRNELCRTVCSTGRKYQGVAEGSTKPGEHGGTTAGRRNIRCRTCVHHLEVWFEGNKVGTGCEHLAKFGARTPNLCCFVGEVTGAI